MTNEIVEGDKVKTLPPYEVLGCTVKTSFVGIVSGIYPSGLATVQDRPNGYHRPVPVSHLEKVTDTVTA